MTLIPKDQWYFAITFCCVTSEQIHWGTLEKKLMKSGQLKKTLQPRSHSPQRNPGCKFFGPHLHILIKSLLAFEISRIKMQLLETKGSSFHRLTCGLKLTVICFVSGHVSEVAVKGVLGLLCYCLTPVPT